MEGARESRLYVTTDVNVCVIGYSPVDSYLKYAITETQPCAFPSIKSCQMFQYYSSVEVTIKVTGSLICDSREMTIVFWHLFMSEYRDSKLSKGMIK